MFCYQCEQTVGGNACTKVGVCGKQPSTSNLQDDLTIALVKLANASANGYGDEDAKLMMQGLFTTITNVNFDDKSIQVLVNKINSAAKDLDVNVNTDLTLWEGNQDEVSLRSTLLFGMRGMAAYAWHAYRLGFEDQEVTDWFFSGMRAIGQSHEVSEWLQLLNDFGHINLRCMELLDKANTSTYGSPAPTKVTTNVDKGPFIVISGHDLHDLKMLLEQTQDKGVNVYTHGEMLPAHGYPELSKYSNLKGNYGTAWQNQQKEFDGLPAPILFTTNCIQKPRDSYVDRVYTTDVVGFPGLIHINESSDGHKDFSKLIDQAIELGGFSEDKDFTGINGGSVLTTGFAHDTVLSAADTVVEAVKAGDISHFFLVGGCDGAKPGRNYYTEFVEKSPKDSIILTLACGKFRFNDLDLGEIGGLPRIMDMGQCNDAFSAIKVAVALAEAFDCGVNELPLSLVLSWYEQKAVCILLTLLALGIKDIYIGPTAPAFFSENVLTVLVDNYSINLITTPEEDLATILG
jgi:hydroxylamine reductase